VFGHVLAYLRDGVVGAGYERDVRMLGRLQREFDFCCVDLLGVCAVDSDIYVIGGLNHDNKHCAEVYKYDPASDTWSEMAPMSQARYNFGMFVAGSCIYAVGGQFTDESHFASMEKKEAESDRWSAACSMAGPRFTFQTCVLTTQENVFDAMMRRALQ
jgi:hypothetical protein